MKKQLKKIDNLHWEYKGMEIFKMNSGWFRVSVIGSDNEDDYYEYPESSIKRMCVYIDRKN